MKRFMLVALCVLFLSGCTIYDANDQSQRFYKIVENFGQRINVDASEFCFTSPVDNQQVVCFQNVQNSYLEGLWILPKLQETITIYRNPETEMLEIQFADGTISQLVFADQDGYFIIGGESTIYVRILASQDAGVFILEGGNVFEMKRLSQGTPT